MSNLDPYTFLQGNSETEKLARSLDWDNYEIGAPEDWPTEIRFALQQVFSSPFPMFVAWGSRLEVIYNDAFIRLLGGKHPRVMGQPHLEIWAEVREGLEPFVKKALAGEALLAEDVSFDILRGNSLEKVWVMFSYNPIRGIDGNVIGIHNICVETTQTHRALAQYRESQQRLQELNETLESQVAERTAERDRMWDTSPDLMLVNDFNGYFRQTNSAWMAILGYTRNELIGRHVNEFVIQSDHALTIDAYKTAAASSLPVTQNRYRHKDGSIRWISWVAAPDGNLTYSIGRDITAEKEREAELEVAHQALRQSQKMEAVGQLTGGLAHDFNNLLASISGGLQVLKLKLQRGQYGGLERYINIGETSIQRAASLTQRLLAFSRRQTLDPKATDVNYLIAGMEELVRRSTGPNIELRVVSAHDLWTTKVDPPQLENALLNLCINSRDAMMPNGGRLTIVTSNQLIDERIAKEREMRPGEYVSLCVSDTGTGMTTEVMARIFDPFYTTKPIGEGTGLGLSMVYGFIQQSDGQVHVRSDVGVGTTMCLYLPRYDGAPHAQAHVESPSITSGRDETVLLIEDERALRDIIEEVLRETGYRVLTAYDGSTGLQILNSDTHVDLLVTDVGLPGGLNGRQVADAARVSRPGLRVLFITGYADVTTIGNGRIDHGMEVMTKPFEISALTHRVRKLIDTNRPH
jgi:PAS domain S-box-containing protein